MARFTSPGLLNINKPEGMSSREVVDLVGSTARTRRVGHAGTLDPLATGVLVICLNWATRLVPFVQQLPKLYRAEFLLGQTSDTDDITGKVEQMPAVTRPAREEVERRLRGFVGRIQQVPPAHSAVHVGGRRAYELARQGEAVELAPRTVEVYRIELIEFDFPRVTVDIECGSGTYVRSIGRDLGQALGCGALMSALERRAIGRFRVEDAVLPAALRRDDFLSHLLPPITAVQHLPQFVCPPELLLALKQGRPLAAPAELMVTRPPQTAIVDQSGTLLGMAEPTPDGNSLQPRHVFCGEPHPPQSG